MKCFAAAALAGLSIALPACASAAPTSCASTPADVAAVDRTIRAFFDSLKREDDAGFRAVTTDAFYSFDAGKRFDGGALFGAVREAHARGVQLVWNIGAIDTHVGCGTAWAAWENHGSAGIPPNIPPVRWLESAVLVRDGGEWKIAFFHSARAAPAKP